jgi:hypothetical protein
MGGPRARTVSQSLLGGQESVLPFGIGMQEFVPFSPYVGEEAGAMVREGQETDSGLTTGLGLGMGALQALPVAKPLARGAKAAGKALGPKAAEMAEGYLLKSGLAPSVIKPKGGNWLAGTVEQSTKPLKDEPVLSGEIINEASGRDLFRDYRKSYDKDPTIGLHQWMREKHPDVYASIQTPEDAALNSWVDTKLNKYIKNEMATPEDPVRALAERGVLHVDPMQVGINRYRAPDERARQGYPKYGVSEAAMAWEDSTDVAIKPWTAGEISQTWPKEVVERDPWLAKVDPGSKVYEPRRASVEGLGFNHLIDELRNATRADSDLPANLRWKPEDLKKVTMAQAVERVAKINEWRAAQMEAARKAAREGIPLHKEYEGGYQWMAAPDTAANPKSLQYIKDVGCESGWCTQGEGIAKKYGGDEGRLYVLHDPAGKPVVQISVKTTKRELPEREIPWEVTNELLRN